MGSVREQHRIPDSASEEPIGSRYQWERDFLKCVLPVAQFLSIDCVVIV